MEPAASRKLRVTLAPGGLVVGGETVPLYAGSVHYWRLDPREWRRALAATRALGVRMIDLYVPWGVHETAPGEADFGATDPRLDVAAFVRMIGELGMYAIVRPGPHINAELTFFGLPERIVWDPECQARSPQGHPVMLPMVPLAFPVPSYASDKFHAEVARWFRNVGPVLAPLRWPDGPIVLLQVDNEGALYFRDGAYDQDYRPEAVERYRTFLRDKYEKVVALRDAHADPDVTFQSARPPVRFDAEVAHKLARHLDWAEFHEHLLATSLAQMAEELRDAGLSELPTMHNFPFGQEATPLNASRIAPGAVDFVGLDYYHKAGADERGVIARRTTELAARSLGLGHPAFACEMGAGFPPFFPLLDEADSAFTVMTALAYGLRGFNVYMMVERDRWIGAPIDRHGRRRPFADFYEKLFRALEEVRFHELVHRMPVRLVTPRSQRRLARVMHAFGPASGAMFAVAGAGARESCLEADFGLGGPVALEADAFVRAFEQALAQRGVPFAHVGGEAADVALDGAAWIVCATTGGMKPLLFERLRQAAAKGALVTIGPRAPERDGAMRPLDAPLDPRALESHPGVRALVASADPAVADRAVATAVERLGLPVVGCDPHGIFATVHETRGGEPVVLFVMNPGSDDVVARVGAAGIVEAVDLLDGAHVGSTGGALDVRMPPRTVRMLRVKRRSA